MDFKETINEGVTVVKEKVNEAKTWAGDNKNKIILGACAGVSLVYGAFCYKTGFKVGTKVGILGTLNYIQSKGEAGADIPARNGDTYNFTCKKNEN